MMPKQTKQQFWFATAAVVAIALFTYLHDLDKESLFHDEIRQVSTYSLTYGQILREAATHPQPPLAYWVGKLVGSPDSDFAIRIPSVLFGAGSVFLLILLCSRFISGPAAALPGLILALLPFHTYYSQHIRPYGIAIFFCLATFWGLDRLLKLERPPWHAYLILFALATAFLWSRVLAPMVTIAGLMILLAARTAAAWRRLGLWRSHEQRKRLLCLLTLALSLLAFLPLFRLVLAGGNRWASSEELSAASLVLKGLGSADYRMMWEAYIVQLEPLGLLLLPFVAAAPFLALSLREWREVPILGFAPLLLPLAAFLETVAFSATIRIGETPYGAYHPKLPTWMLPLCLISAAATIHLVWQRLSVRLARGRIVLGLFVLLLLATTVRSEVAFKGTLKNDDWRGVCAYLQENFDQRHVIIFEGLTLRGVWEPTFYGFPRYYRGSSPMLAILDMARNSRRLVGLPHEPVFLVWHARSFFLTPSSRYSFVPHMNKVPDVGTGTLDSDPALDVRSFVGFSVVRLKNRQGDLASSTYEIMERIIADIPAGYHMGELHLACAFLGKTIGALNWREHLQQANLLRDDARYRAMFTLIERG